MIKRRNKYCYLLKPYVTNVLVFEQNDSSTINVLPFFADGYPGIVFNFTSSGLYLRGKETKLSDLFLYGQTLEPIELCVNGAYKMIVFQLFPFAIRLLLGFQPKILNDDCFDLSKLKECLDQKTVLRLNETNDTDAQIKIISTLIHAVFEKTLLLPDESILTAVHLILQFKGNISIKDVREKLFVSERTLERRFVKEIGVTPKIFAKIIQFQFSLDQINSHEEIKMIDVVYKNGFFDHSHFIKSFKKFTGMTPSEFQNLPAVANFLAVVE